MLKKVSIKDIAEKVGVSTALVSYVMNGKEKEKRVGAEVVKKIRETASEMNYVPNQIARSLRKGNTKTLGLILADIANPFFGTLARVVEDEASKYGFTVIIGSSDENCDKLGALVDTFYTRQVDGYLIVPTEGAMPHISKLLKNNEPVVLVDRYFKELDVNYVLLDNYAATFEATLYLIEKGYKRIGMVAHKSELVHMQERVRGYCAAMTSGNLANEIWVEHVRYDHAQNDTRKVLEKMTKGEVKVDAVILATNSLSVNSLYYFKEANLKIPADFGIIGFDGNEVFDFFYSPLTYISQPVDEMGKEAVRMIIDQINGSRKTVQVKLKHQLIMGQSCR